MGNCIGSPRDGNPEQLDAAKPLPAEIEQHLHFIWVDPNALMVSETDARLESATLVLRAQALMEMGGYSGQQKLVFNLVACNLDQMESESSGMTYRFEDGDYVRYVSSERARNIRIERHLHHLAIGTLDPERTSGYAGFWQMANDVSTAGKGNQYMSDVWVDPGALLVDAVGREIDLWAEYEVVKGISRGAFDNAYRGKRGVIAFEEAVSRAGLAKRLELNARLKGIEGGAADQLCSRADKLRLTFLNELRRERKARGDAKVAPQMILGELQDHARDIWAGIEQGRYRNFEALVHTEADRALVDGYRQELDLRQNLNAAENIARALIFKHEGGVVVGRNLLPQFDAGFLKELLIELQKNGVVLDADLAERLAGQAGVDAAAIPADLFDFITDQVVIEQGMIRHRLLERYPLRPIPQLVLRDDASEKNLSVLFRSAIANVIGKQKAGGAAVIFQPLGDLSNKLGVSIGRTNFGDAEQRNRGDGGLNDQLVAFGRGSAVAGKLYARILAVYKLLSDPEIKVTLEKLAAHESAGHVNGHSTSDDISELELALHERVTILWAGLSEEPLDDMLVADLLDYMSESRVDEQGSGSYINGQQHLAAVVERFIADASMNGVSSEQALESLLGGEFNDRSADAALVRGLVRDAWASALQKRLPQVAMLWTAPELPSGLEDHDSGIVSEDDSTSSFNYGRQLIIQIDGDDVVRLAAQRLYGKHPDKSAYFQWVEGQDLKPFFNDLGPPSGYTAENGLRALLDGRSSMRITFVGHGTVQDGHSSYANRSATGFLRNLRSLFEEGLRASGNHHDRWLRFKLVINLVGCELDDFAPKAGVSFAGEVANGLPKILGEFGVPLGDVELHARQGRMSVDKSGRKSNVTIKYKFAADNPGGQTGRYVREMPLVPTLKDRQRDVEDLNTEATEVNAAQDGNDLGYTEHVDTWLDRLVKLGMREKPVGTAFELPEGSADHNVVVALGPVASNQKRAAALFNNDPRHSTYIAIDNAEPDRAVFLDKESGTLVVREGWSSLIEARGRKTIRVVGAGGGSVDAPLFQNHSPAELANLLEPVLRRATPGSAYGQAGKVVIMLIRDEAQQPHQFSDANYVQALSDALLPKLASCGLSLEDIEFSVSDGHPAYTRNGAPGFLTAEGGMLIGTLGEVYQKLHEVRMRHDGTESGPFQRVRFSIAELQDFAKTLEALRTQGNLDEVGQIHLGAAIRKVAALFHEDLSTLQRQAPHRDEREKMLVELQEVNKLREERNSAIASIVPPEGKGWLLMPEHVEALAGDRRFRVAYVRTDGRGTFDPEHPEIQWRETEDDVFMRWANKARALGETLSKGVSRAASTGEEAVKYFFAGDTEGGAAHTLTAAFLLQSLIGTQYAVFKGTEEQAIEAMIGAPISKLSKEELANLKVKLASLRKQAIVNYAQLTAGLIAEAGEMIKLVSILRGAETTVNLLAKVGAVASVLSIAFDVANVVFAIIDLANATTPQEKVDAGLRVGIASVGAAVNLGAISAGAVAAVQGAVAASAAEAGAVAAQASALAAAGTAATVGAILGATGVLVAGLGIGVYAVYGAYQGVYNKQVAYLDELESAAIAVRSHAINVEQGVLSFPERLALESLDLRTGQYTYGDVKFRAFVTHAFAVPDGGASMAKEWLSMYEPYIHSPAAGSTDATALNDVAIVLPVGLNRDYSWSLSDDPGLLGVDRDAAYPALSDLAARYPDRFFYIYRAMYIVSYGPSDLHVEYKNTPFSLMLDEAARSVVIPSIEQDAYRGYLSYTLVGGGGEYSLVLPRWPVALDIAISASAKERWSFDLSTQAYAQGLPGDTLADSQMLEGFVKSIHLSQTELTINGSKWATFSRAVPQHITFSIRLSGGEGKNGDSIILAFTRDVQTGHDRYVLSVPQVLRLAGDEITNIRRLLLASGIAEPYLMVADNDGGSGLLDLENNMIYASRTAHGAVTYEVNGKRRFLVAGDKPLDFATVVNQGQTERVVMWHINADMRADLSYVDDQIQSAIVRTSPESLQTLMAQSNLSTFNFLGEWLDQIPSGRTVFFVDGEGGIAAGIRDQSANHPFMLTQYSNQQDAVKIALDKRHDRAMISASGVDSFGPQDLVHYTTLLSSVSVIELVLTGIMDRRMHIDINLNAPMFRGKRIVMLSDKSVDLALAGEALSWTGDGPDVLFKSDDNTVLHWLEGEAKGGKSHTLDIDGSAQPLDVALENLPNMGSATTMAMARTANMSITQQLPTNIPDHVMPDSSALSDRRGQWVESANRLSQSISTLSSGDVVASLTAQTSGRPGLCSVLTAQV